MRPGANEVPQFWRISGSLSQSKQESHALRRVGGRSLKTPSMGLATLCWANNYGFADSKVRHFVLDWLGHHAIKWIGKGRPWTNVYGVSRTLLAAGTILTLVSNRPSTLFRSIGPHLGAPLCEGHRGISFFCVMPSGALEPARWICVAALVVVASGWRPRITALLHWWLTFSLQASATVVDGGDQIAAVLTLLLLPIALTDGRRWHWEGRDRLDGTVESRGEGVARLFALSASVAIRVQVAGIYFHAAVGKFGVQDWQNGTALYYWTTNPVFGAPPWLLSVVLPLFNNAVVLCFATWGVMVFEFFLASGLFMAGNIRRVALPLGIFFHCAIAITHGLVSFGFAMCAALVLYLYPIEDEFVAPRWLGVGRKVFLYRCSRPRGSVASID